MIPEPLTWDDFEEMNDKASWSEAQDVVVEHLYKEDLDSPVLTALFPAKAWIDNRTEEMIVEYTHIVSCNHIVRRFSYNKENMPTMYPRKSMQTKLQLALALGALILWDKKNDTIVKPAAGRPAQWFMLWRNEPWYTWDNDTQSYSKQWKRGMTAEEYELSFIKDESEKYNEVMKRKRTPKKS